ncbi:UvrD-helicase domain-containing protein [Rhodococcus opacus]|uniref:UvrD-helicase domain-containing protein n=1 Tax=Rhodococcus opacus TaxID=37919 RepID=UPI00031A57A1|nr:UvrD-helicase domain-containing protein [Rhodococcus opacus]UDG95334.1 UvrD-helicase domain-containing protein [Rhodococcus opacus PD630]
MVTEPFELNDEQRAVVEADIGDRLVVIAGAGQGKTEVVAARIGFLVDEEQLSASSEILVLSFSRAAVSAVRARLELREVAAANVRTFDSFAGQILLDADIEPIGSYEARIRQATRVLNESDEIPFEVESLRHVVMDEVQDLVGDRADFVLALLRRLDSDVGVTALGDPLQGIYDFQRSDSKSKTSSQQVFDAFASEFNARTVGLGQNYRAQGKDPKEVVELGNRLRMLTDAEEAQDVLDEFETSLLCLGEIEDWADMVSVDGTSTAVLCTTNGEVLRVSKYLNERGIRHVVRRQAQDFGAAKWVAQVLGSLEGTVVRRSEVEVALERTLGRERGEEAWYLLKAAEGNARQIDALNIARIRSLVGSASAPLTLTESDDSNVIVSTVHRAKGLEFDRVFLVERSFVWKDEDPWASVRARYVGLSRARDMIGVCTMPRSYALYQEMRWLPGRLLERVNKKKSTKKRTSAVEFRYADVEVDAPVEFEGGNASVVQSNLEASDLVGARLDANLDLGNSTPDLPSYLLTTEDGRTVGRTSDVFNEAFVKAFGLTDGRWPAMLTGLSVVSVETVAGDPRKSQQMDISFAGLWLAPRVVGLAQPDWSMMEEVQ